MSILVQKFGGSSVATPEKILAAAQRAVSAKRAGHQVVVVVSARGHKTDELIELAREITDTPPAREMDMLLSTGEQESVALMAMAVQKLGEQSISLTGAQIGIVTDSTYTKARIRSISTVRMRKALEAGKIVIAAGFQGVDDDFNITTLGRGGSDTTAVALAAVLKASVCEIYTDVEGVFTTDPRLVKDARKIPHIAYDDLLELASLGAGVMHSRSIEFAKKYRVPVLVRPAYSDGEGTLIAPEGNEASVVTGAALANDEVRVSLWDIPDRPGVMNLIFTQMSQRKIPIDMVVQNVGAKGLANVSFTVPQDELAETLTAAQQAVEQLGAGSVQHGTNLAKVSVVGSGMQTHTGVAAQMFSSLAEAGVNIGMITTSDIKISVLVDRNQAQTALAAVHRGFDLHREQPALPPVGVTQLDDDDESDRARDERARDVVSRLANMEDIVVSEVQFDRDQALVTLRNLPDVPGVAAVVFAENAEAGVMVDMIVQNVGRSGHSHISFTVPRETLERSLAATRQAIVQWPDVELSHERDIAKLSVRGIGLRTHTGVGEKMFRALSDASINVRMISTSEVCISTVIELDRGDEAHRCLVAAFGLDPGVSSSTVDCT
ncbi:MAG: aspartate kinase [Planctomycetaceae bacterium]|nr:aspartate kinase [Planctomycetaceae bacterium]